MSRYDDLCKHYSRSRRVHFFTLDAFQTECFEFAQYLVDRLVEYLGVPEGHWRLVPDDQEPDPSRSYTIPEALRLVNRSAWHFGFAITLHEDQETLTAAHEFVLHLAFHKHKNVFRVAVHRGVSTDYKIRPNTDSDFEPFFEHVYNHIVDLLESEFSEVPPRPKFPA
jgi:hypothetical protein